LEATWSAKCHRIQVNDKIVGLFFLLGVKPSQAKYPLMLVVLELAAINVIVVANLAFDEIALQTRAQFS
jgi:hypothetical protein